MWKGKKSDVRRYGASRLHEKGQGTFLLNRKGKKKNRNIKKKKMRAVRAQARKKQKGGKSGIYEKKERGGGALRVE